MAIREGRQQCHAHRRDGNRCSAPAIPGGTVCRVHGGSAPQVQRAARRVVLMERLAAAVEAWQADPGIPGQLTSRQIDLLGKAAIAERDLAEYERKLTVIRLLRTELRLQARERADPMRQRETAEPHAPACDPSRDAHAVSVESAADLRQGQHL
jgi:hypothetical protein